MRAQRVPFGALLRWLGGPLIWAAHFLLVYASESLVCTRGGGGSHLLIVVAASVAAVAALVAIIIRGPRAARATPERPGAVFMDVTSAFLGVLCLIAVLWIVVPAMLVPACLPPA